MLINQLQEFHATFSAVECRIGKLGSRYVALSGKGTSDLKTLTRRLESLVKDNRSLKDAHAVKVLNLLEQLDSRFEALISQTGKVKRFFIRLRQRLGNLWYDDRSSRKSLRKQLVKEEIRTLKTATSKKAPSFLEEIREKAATYQLNSPEIIIESQKKASLAPVVLLKKQDSRPLLRPMMMNPHLAEALRARRASIELEHS